MMVDFDECASEHTGSAGGPELDRHGRGSPSSRLRRYSHEFYALTLHKRSVDNSFRTWLRRKEILANPTLISNITGASHEYAT
jgi:hypothetical protein